MADPSALDAALARVGDRWSLLLVDALQAGAARFNELAEALPGLAPSTLSQRLKQLEAEGVVLARPYQERPVRHSYELTAAGRELAGALRLLAQWGAGPADGAEGPVHDACGTALEARWFCPTCGHDVADDETGDLHLA